MGSPRSVALLGFSRFERATFESFFRLAAKREPSYAYADDAGRADFVVADADDDASRSEVRRLGLASRAILLGQRPFPDAAVQLRRPINLMLVVRALDAMPGGDAPPPPAAPSPHVTRVLETLSQTMPAPLEPPPAPPPQPARGRLDHILVVDDSDIALRFMAQHLQRFGFEIHLAKSGAEALRKLTQREFDFVFLDVTMEGMDGFQTCKAIKRADYSGGRKPPTVVMLTSRGGPVDKLRGTMAGCDAYLTKPLQEPELLKIIGEREVQRHAYADTAAATTML